MIDMLRLLPQYAPGEFDSRHRVAIIAGQRATHIVQGSRHAPSRFTKETAIALDEVLTGQTKYLVGEEARAAVKETMRGRADQIEPIARVTGDDAKEIKTELGVYAEDKPKPVIGASEE